MSTRHVKILENLKKAIIEYDNEEAASWAEKAVKEKIEFIEAIRKYKANILAMSSLMTTTVSEQKKIIETLKKGNLRDKVKVMVGGGAITQEFADSIGADGYDPTAPGAVKLAKNLVGK